MEFWELEAAFMVDREQEGGVEQRGEERESYQGGGGRVKEEKEKGSCVILPKCRFLSLFFVFQADQ